MTIPFGQAIIVTRWWHWRRTPAGYLDHAVIYLAGTPLRFGPSRQLFHFTPSSFAEVIIPFDRRVGVHTLLSLSELILSAVATVAADWGLSTTMLTAE